MTNQGNGIAPMVEQWEFAANGLMQRREASINDVLIQESERKFVWERSS